MNIAVLSDYNYNYDCEKDKYIIFVFVYYLLCNYFEFIPNKFVILFIIYQHI